MKGILEHYQDLYLRHGDSPHAVQLSDKRSQERRFEILSQIAAQLGTVGDIGCGLGHFFAYLKRRGFRGSYKGVDFVPEFIEAARVKYADAPRARFSVCDIEKGALPTGCDYLFLSGVFNNKRRANERFMYSTIGRMFRAARKGVAFNAMSTYVDYQDKSLYYSDPLKVFDFCKRRLTSKVTLRHDYLVKDNSIPFEYAVYLYK
ncbi:MAG: class I SAM-dependent methyltransferase [Elusimicrobia bacterium]|nr:class I SAM-dependent methyltransferase [Elusimicrobiota bacterium]